MLLSPKLLDLKFLFLIPSKCPTSDSPQGVNQDNGLIINVNLLPHNNMNK
jgi:hypothetical protein